MTSLNSLSRAVASGEPVLAAWRERYVERLAGEPERERRALAAIFAAHSDGYAFVFDTRALPIVSARASCVRPTSCSQLAQCAAARRPGACDVASSAAARRRFAPANRCVASGTVCRASADVCDAAEVCNGADTTSGPLPMLAPSGTV